MQFTVFAFVLRLAVVVHNYLIWDTVVAFDPIALRIGLPDAELSKLQADCLRVNVIRCSATSSATRIHPPLTNGLPLESDSLWNAILSLHSLERSRALAERNFTIGIVQMSCTPDPEENMDRAITHVREAAKQGAELICLPELFQTQYFCQREDTVAFRTGGTDSRTSHATPGRGNA